MPRPDIGSRPGAARGLDLEAIASSVPGVRDAALVTHRRLRLPDRLSAHPPERVSAAPGRPIPGTRKAIATGAPMTLGDGAARTLAQALAQAAELAGDRGTTYVLSNGEQDRQTYRQLYQEGCRVLTGLRRLGLRPGDAVLMQCADSRSFVTGFWACVLGGFLPTPVGPALDYRTENAATRKLRAAWELLDRALILADESLADQVTGLGKLWAAGAAPAVSCVTDLLREQQAVPEPVTEDSPVLNLLTSGSTGTPKCVRHLNRSIVARTYAAVAANGFTEHEVSLNWMPLDHVGGIVMCNVRDVFLRCEHVNALTEAFVQRPVAWLDWIDRYRATNTWAPNFAFALVNKQAAQISAGHWDLASMRHICDAGEPVVARTAHRFLELLGPHRLPPDAIVPCWGMSETSSGVTYSRLDVRDRGAGTVTIDPASLDRQLVVLDSGAFGAMVATECGPPIAGVSLRITDDHGTVLPEGRIGHLHVTGSTLMREYFQNPAANAASMREDGWFDTGDLAFLRDGRLALTGRSNDMVIVNGANFPAHEIESVIEQVPGVQPTFAAVCGAPDAELGTDAVLVFFAPEESADVTVVATAIRAALARELGIRPHVIAWVTPAEFPRTASGKIQRQRLAQALQAGQLAGRSIEQADAEAASKALWMTERVWSAAAAQAVSGGQDQEPAIVYAPAGLEARGENLGIIVAGDGFGEQPDGRMVISPLDAGQHERALAALMRRLGRPVRVIYAWESERPPAGERPEAVCCRWLAMAGALSRSGFDGDLVVLTCGALGVSGADQVEPAVAALAALVRTAAAEGRFRSARLIDLPPGAAGTGRAMLDLAGLAPGADLAAWRDGEFRLPRLRLIPVPGSRAIPPAFLPPSGGTVLLAGGLGALAQPVAEHLLTNLGARLLIVGRTAEAGLAADSPLADLRSLGDVRYAAVDVADAGPLEQAVCEAESHWARSLDLVIHLAGTPVAPQWARLDQHELRHETAQWLTTMLRPKLAGGVALDAVLSKRPGAAVIAYSSVNGYLGGAAFGAYSAANAALDGFAHRWAARGHPVRCLGWSMWSGPGMNDGSPLVAAAQRRGLRLIEPSRGLELFLAALNQPANSVLIGLDPASPQVQAHLADEHLTDGDLVVVVVPDEEAPPDIVVGRVADALGDNGQRAEVITMAQIPRDASGLVDDHAVLATRARWPAGYAAPSGPAEETVASVYREVLGANLVGRDDSFFALGGDSIRSMQVAGRLSEEVGRQLAVSAIYEYPVVRELAAVLAEHRPASAPATTP